MPGVPTAMSRHDTSGYDLRGVGGNASDNQLMEFASGPLMATSESLTGSIVEADHEALLRRTGSMRIHTTRASIPGREKSG